MKNVSIVDMDSLLSQGWKKSHDLELGVHRVK
jgi:hypothetical protein